MHFLSARYVAVERRYAPHDDEVARSGLLCLYSKYQPARTCKEAISELVSYTDTKDTDTPYPTIPRLASKLSRGTNAYSAHSWF